MPKEFCKRLCARNCSPHLPPEIFRAILNNLEQEKKIAVEKDIVRLASHSLELSADEKLLRERLLKIYKSANLEVPKLEDALQDSIKNTRSDANHARKVFQLFLNSGEIVKITEEFYFAKTAIEGLIKQLNEFAK